VAEEVTASASVANSAASASTEAEAEVVSLNTLITEVVTTGTVSSKEALAVTDRSISSSVDPTAVGGVVANEEETPLTVGTKVTSGRIVTANEAETETEGAKVVTKVDEGAVSARVADAPIDSE
jgi:hypothetical protein